LKGIEKIDECSVLANACGKQIGKIADKEILGL
jgi:hypothetical protein